MNLQWRSESNDTHIKRSNSYKFNKIDLEVEISRQNN